MDSDLKGVAFQKFVRLQSADVVEKAAQSTDHFLGVDVDGAGQK